MWGDNIYEAHQWGEDIDFENAPNVTISLNELGLYTYELTCSGISQSLQIIGIL